MLFSDVGFIWTKTKTITDLGNKLKNKGFKLPYLNKTIRKDETIGRQLIT